jgi:hypothetical protein
MPSSIRNILRYRLILIPVYFLCLIQFALFVYTIYLKGDLHPQVVKLEQDETQGRYSVKVENRGAFRAMFQVNWYAYYQLTPGPHPITRYTEYSPDLLSRMDALVSLPDWCSDPRFYCAVEKVCVQALGLEGWQTIYCDEDVLLPASYSVQGLLLFEFVLICSVIADFFCIIISLCTNCIVAVPGIISLITSVVVFAIVWDQGTFHYGLLLLLILVSLLRFVWLLIPDKIYRCIKGGQDIDEETPFISFKSTDTSTT